LTCARRRRDTLESASAPATLGLAALEHAFVLLQGHDPISALCSHIVTGE
jgi:hypothetical protein